MSQIVLEIPDGKDDIYTVERFDSIAADLDTVNLDGGHLILMAPDRGIAVDTPLEYVKADVQEDTAEKPAKKKGSKK